MGQLRTHRDTWRHVKPHACTQTNGHTCRGEDAFSWMAREGAESALGPGLTHGLRGVHARWGETDLMSGQRWWFEKDRNWVTFDPMPEASLIQSVAWPCRDFIRSVVFRLSHVHKRTTTERQYTPHRRSSAYTRHLLKPFLLVLSSLGCIIEWERYRQKTKAEELWNRLWENNVYF